MNDMDTEFDRLARIFGAEEVPDVDDETLQIYLDHLQENLELPCFLKPMELFSWEEAHLFGHMSDEEYEEEKKTRPARKDVFQFLRFEDNVEESHRILVKVKRVSDKKRFSLPLDRLEATEKESKNYQLLGDYSGWYVNHR